MRESQLTPLEIIRNAERDEQRFVSHALDSHTSREMDRRGRKELRNGFLIIAGCILTFVALSAIAIIRFSNY